MIAIRSVFADASYYIAIFNRADQHHQNAARWQAYIRRELIQIVTTEAVMWETLNSLSSGTYRSLLVEFCRRMQTSSREQVIGFDAPTVERALDLYASHSDKSWGITDCYSFVVMQDCGMTDALSADHHFRQAGFNALLHSEPPG